MSNQQNVYRYSLISTEYSSHRYGPCEVCNKHVSEVFSQSEERQFEYEGGIHWTYNKCFDLFGHKECLIGKRRNTHTSKEQS